MANPIINTLNNIHNADELTINFINEWFNDLPYIVAYTSGSTGTPKEIKLLKSDMIASAKATCEFFGINNNSNLVLPLSVNYIAGKMMIVRAIISGARLWIEAPSNNPLISDYGQIDLLPIVPSQIQWLTTYSKFVNNIKNLLVGGGAVPYKSEQSIINKRINAYVSYGMTETCSHIALRNISSSIYKTLPGITIEKNANNCLVINTPHFSFKKVSTNDIVEIIDENHFKWIGRYDNVINTGGIKCFPEDIEKILSPYIDSPYYIIGEPNEKWGEIIVLYIESDSFDTQSLMNQAEKLLNKYQVPKKIKCISRFNRTESGKIIRQRF